MTNLRDDFCAALDSQLIEPADAAIVLRNWNADLTHERFDHALDLILNHTVPLMLVTDDTNTLTESNRVFNIALELLWKKVIIVTHRSHHYRAYLTFLNTFRESGVKVISCPVESGWDEAEFRKIEEYQQQGDIASYEEGICQLNLS